MTRQLALLIVIGLITNFGAAPACAQSTPVRPKPPAIKNRDWIQIPLDAFILHRLEAAKLKPAAEATREDSLRRVTLALAGRPATATEVATFVASRDKRVYEKEVDRLLDSPGFADRFADVARLMKKDDPPTARAAANRAWQKLVGRPLVAVDGSGHVDALEWLTCELLDPTLVNCCELDKPLPEAWDLKHLVRAIVISAIYRQSGSAMDESMRRVP